MTRHGLGVHSHQASTSRACCSAFECMFTGRAPTTRGQPALPLFPSEFARMPPNQPQAC